MNVVATTQGLGRIQAGEVLVVDLPYRDVGALVAVTGSLEAVATAPVRYRVPASEADITAPVPSPGAVWGVGLNYHSKASAAGRAVPDSPICYLAARSAVCGPGQDIELPADATRELDYEGEVALVVGRRLYRAAPRDVWPAVAGVTAANDVTARDVMTATGTPALAKSFPGSKPLGASVRGLDEIPDPADIGVRAWVNGELRQDGRTTDLIFPVPELVAWLSRFTVLEPGDIVLTGTPAGTGQDLGTFLRPGDLVTVAVEGVLPLGNRVCAAMDTARN